MSSDNLISYMAWVPILGSAMGSMIGGFISDSIMKWINSSNDIDEIDDSSENGSNPVDRFLSGTTNPLLTKGSSSIHTLDGFLLDRKKSTQHFRMFIVGISNLLSLPLVCLALFLDFPYCFLILIFSGLVIYKQLTIYHFLIFFYSI